MAEANGVHKMKKITLSVLMVSLFAVGHAQAQSTSTAQQNSTSQSVAQGTIQFSQSPADQHLTETVHNVSAPVLGAYAGSFSQMGCGSTAQAGLAVAGVSLVGGASHSMQDCVSEVAANETMKQATADPENAPRLRAAAVAIRCQVSEEVYKAYIAAGLDCKGLKPKSMESRTDTQPASTRVE